MPPPNPHSLYLSRSRRCPSLYIPPAIYNNACSSHASITANSGCDISKHSIFMIKHIMSSPTTRACTVVTIISDLQTHITASCHSRQPRTSTLPASCSVRNSGCVSASPRDTPREETHPLNEVRTVDLLVGRAAPANVSLTLPRSKGENSTHCAPSSPRPMGSSTTLTGPGRLFAKVSVTGIDPPSRVRSGVHLYTACQCATSSQLLLTEHGYSNRRPTSVARIAAW